MRSVEEALTAAGWTPWAGGSCPVPDSSYSVVLLAGGETDCERAGDFAWIWDSKYPLDNVIAYKELK